MRNINISTRNDKLNWLKVAVHASITWLAAFIVLCLEDNTRLLLNLAISFTISMLSLTALILIHAIQLEDYTNVTDSKQ